MEKQERKKETRIFKLLKLSSESILEYKSLP